MVQTLTRVPGDHHPFYVQDLVSNHIKPRQKIHMANESACQTPSTPSQGQFRASSEGASAPPLFGKAAASFQGENIEMDLPVTARAGNTPGKTEFESAFSVIAIYERAGLLDSPRSFPATPQP